MWMGFAVLSVGLVMVGFVMVLLEIRTARSTRRQSSELARRVERLQSSVDLIRGQMLCELLVEECDAALEDVSNMIPYREKLEKGMPEEHQDCLRRRAPSPFLVEFRPDASPFGSKLLRKRLAMLRAIKHRYHANPKTFSRETEWFFSGNHDRLLKHLNGHMPDPRHPPIVGQEYTRSAETEEKGGVV